MGESKMKNEEVKDIKFNDMYRPGVYKDVIGQKDVLKLLDNSILLNSVQNAYIFEGESGLGKTTVARIFANKLICKHLDDNLEPCGVCEACRDFKNNPRFADIIEIDCGTDSGVDDIRSLKENLHYSPKYEYRVHIIDEAHRLSKDAFNALLKILEEPPKGNIFILVSTNPEKFLKTIKTRCFKITFKPVSSKEIESKLLEICSEQEIAITDEALYSISNGTKGGVREAIKILQQASTLSNKNIKIEHLTGLVKTEAKYIKGLLNLILKGQTSGILEYIDKEIDSIEEEDFDFLINRLRKILLLNDLSNKETEILLDIIKVIIENKNKSTYNVKLETLLEVISIESCLLINKSLNKDEQSNLIKLLEDKSNKKDVAKEKDSIEESIIDTNKSLVLNKIDLFLSILGAHNSELKSKLEKFDIFISSDNKYLCVLVDDEASNQKVRKILTEKISQNIKPIIGIDGFIVKIKEEV